MTLRRLKPGDVVGVAALSGPPTRRTWPGDAPPSRRWDTGSGSPERGAEDGSLGLAGADTERLAGYRGLLLDGDVAAILFARGGYGVTPLLPLLDPEEIAAHPKIHCGFSDLTALSGFLLSRCGLPSFHGPMVAADLARGLDPLSASFFPALLEGRGPSGLPMPGPTSSPAAISTGGWSAGASRSSRPGSEPRPSSRTTGRSSSSRTSAKRPTGSTGCSSRSGTPGDWLNSRGS